MSVYPTPTEVFITKKPVLFTARRSLRSFTPWLAYLVPVFLIIYLVERFAAPRSRLLGSFFTYTPSFLLYLIPIACFLELVRRYYDNLYIFEQHRITHVGGRYGLAYRVPAIYYTDIQGICVKQGLLGRLLNFGDIEVGTAAYEEVEVLIVGVRRPVELMYLIDALSKKRLEEFAQNPRRTAAGAGVD